MMQSKCRLRRRRPLRDRFLVRSGLPNASRQRRDVCTTGFWQGAIPAQQFRNADGRGLVVAGRHVMAVC